VTGRSFKIEQIAFRGQSAAVAAEATSGRDHPVAGDDDCHAVGAVGTPDRAIGGAGTHALGELAVADRPSVRDALQLIPDARLEGAARRIDRQVEVATVTGKVVL